VDTDKKKKALDGRKKTCDKGNSKAEPLTVATTRKQTEKIRPTGKGSAHGTHIPTISKKKKATGSPKDKKKDMKEGKTQREKKKRTQKGGFLKKRETSLGRGGGGGLKTARHVRIGGLQIGARAKTKKNHETRSSD